MAYENHIAGPIPEDTEPLGNSPIGDVSQSLLGKYYDSFRPHEAAIKAKADEVMGNLPAGPAPVEGFWNAFGRGAIGGAAQDLGLVARGVKTITGMGTEETGLEKWGSEVTAGIPGIVDTWNAAFDGDPETDYHWDAAFGGMLGQVAGFMVPIAGAEKAAVGAARAGRWAATKLLRTEAPKFIGGAIEKRMAAEGTEKVLLDTFGKNATEALKAEAAGSEALLRELGTKAIVRKAEDRIGKIAATGALYSLATGDMTAAKIEAGQEMDAGNRLEAAALAIPATALMSIVPTKVMDTMFHAAPVELLPKALRESAAMDSFKKIFYDKINERGLLFRQSWAGRVGQDAVIQSVAMASNEALKAVAGKNADEPWAEVFNQEFAKRAIEAAVSGGLMGATFGGVHEIMAPKATRGSFSDREEQQLQSTEASRKISADGVMLEGKGFISPETVATAEAGVEAKAAAEVQRMKDEAEEIRTAREEARILEPVGVEETQRRLADGRAEAAAIEATARAEQRRFDEELRAEEAQRAEEKLPLIQRIAGVLATAKDDKARVEAIKAEVAADNARIDAEAAAAKARKEAEALAKQEETKRKQTIAYAQKRLYDAGVTEGRKDEHAVEAVARAEELKQRKFLEITDTFDEGKIRDFLDSRGEITRDTQSLGELKNQAKRYVERRTEEVLPFILREVQAERAKGKAVEPALARTWDELSKITKDKNEYPLMGKKDLPAARAKVEERFSITDEAPKTFSADPEIDRMVRAKHAVDVMKAAQEISWHNQGTRRVNIVVHTKSAPRVGGERAEASYNKESNTVHLFAPDIDLGKPGEMERLLLHEDFGHNVLRSTLAVHGREILNALGKVDPKSDLGKKIQETTALYRQALDREAVNVSDERALAHIQDEVLSALAADPKLYNGFWKRLGFTAKMLLQKMGFNPKFTPEETVTAALREANKKYMREMDLKPTGTPLESTLGVGELKEQAPITAEERARREGVKATEAAAAAKERQIAEEKKTIARDKALKKIYSRKIQLANKNIKAEPGEKKKDLTARRKKWAEDEANKELRDLDAEKADKGENPTPPTDKEVIDLLEKHQESGMTVEEAAQMRHCLGA